MYLSTAIILATKAHDRQVDKLGQPYILHSLRVMQAMETEEERIVAVLHDVVEDTPLTIDDLYSYSLPQHLGAAIDALTRREGEPYLPDYITRVAANPLARKVKLADLADNLSPSRFVPGSEAASRSRRYWKALAMLEVH